MTNNELTWKLAGRIEELASMQRPQLKSEVDCQNDSLRRELSEVKAKHDILLHELNEAQERMSEMDGILAHDPPAKNEKLDAVMEKIRKAVTGLNWVDDINAPTWSFLIAGEVTVTLAEIREAFGWVKP